MPAETFTSNSDDFETTRYMDGPPVTKGPSKTSKTRSLNDRTRFCPMPIVTWVTPGTVDVRIRGTAHR